jgi:hypothetical protein
VIGFEKEGELRSSQGYGLLLACKAEVSSCRAAAASKAAPSVVPIQSMACVLEESSDIYSHMYMVHTVFMFMDKK